MSRATKPLRRAMRTGVAAALCALAAGAAAAETLTDALISAYRTSGLLEQNRALLRAADEDVAQAVTALYPVIEYQVAATKVFDLPPGVDSLTGTADLTARVTLYDGGQNRLAIDAAKETVLATREGLVDVEQRVLLDAVTAYMNVIDGRERVRLTQSNIRLIDRELQAARDRFEVGEITRTDVSLAEARLSQARSDLAVAEGTLATAREAYRAAVGRYPGDLQRPGDAPLPSVTDAEAKARAVRSHPALRQVQRQVTAAEINVARADAARNPAVSLSGRTRAVLDNLHNDQDVFQNSITLGMSGTVYSAGRIDSLVRQAVARAEAQRAQLLITIDALRREAGNAFANLLVARAVLESSNRQVEAQFMAFEGIREEARLGARTTLDVLDAEQALLNARVTVVAAEADRIIAQYALLAAQGLLTVEYLNLGIPTYDPAAYYESVERAPVYTSRQGQALDRVIKSLGLEDR